LTTVIENGRKLITRETFEISLDEPIFSILSPKKAKIGPVGP
jgi:hypothetical protein